VNPKNNNKNKTNAMRIFDFSFITKNDLCYIYHSLIISSLKRYLFFFYLTKWWTHLMKKNSRREGREFLLCFQGKEK